MAGRTNKMWILKTKLQQAKQKKLWGVAKSSMEWQKREYENPKWNSYLRFFRSGKWVNDQTSVREDPDGYRVCRTANSSEIEYKYTGESSFGYRRRTKRIRRKK